MSDVLDEALRLFARGVVDRRSAFHTPSVVTIDEAGAPAVRTVVLRACDAAARTLTFHTDLRSAKTSHLRARPGIALHVYDAAHRIQVRASGLAAVHAGDDAALAAWHAASPGSRDTYRVGLTPGAAVDDPADVDPLALAVEAAYAHFGVVRVALTSLEWLHLAAGGHRRARFTWPDGESREEWLVP